MAVVRTGGVVPGAALRLLDAGLVAAEVTCQRYPDLLSMHIGVGMHAGLGMTRNRAHKYVVSRLYVNLGDSHIIQTDKTGLGYKCPSQHPISLHCWTSASWDGVGNREIRLLRAAP